VYLINGIKTSSLTSSFGDLKVMTARRGAAVKAKVKVTNGGSQESIVSLPMFTKTIDLTDLLEGEGGSASLIGLSCYPANIYACGVNK
jgi:hypothetical protein